MSVRRVSRRCVGQMTINFQLGSHVVNIVFSKFIASCDGDETTHTLLFMLRAVLRLIRRLLRNYSVRLMHAVSDVTKTHGSSLSASNE